MLGFLISVRYLYQLILCVKRSFDVRNCEFELERADKGFNAGSHHEAIERAEYDSQTILKIVGKTASTDFADSFTDVEIPVSLA